MSGVLRVMARARRALRVIAGLVPAMTPRRCDALLTKAEQPAGVDARDKRAHDAGAEALFHSKRTFLL
jgi:hypothetical protein